MSNVEEDKSLAGYQLKEVNELDAGLDKKHENVIDLAARAHLNAVEYTEAESNAVLRKIDWHLMPLLIWIYGIQFADKQTLSYASLMNIRQDIGLDLASQQYSWTGSIFYAGYLAGLPPATYVMKRLPIGKFVATNIVCWAIVLSLHACVTNYTGLLIVRFLLGFFESTITPAFVLVVSMWYRRNEQGGRMALFLAANGLATIICSPIAYGLSGLVDPPIASWRILYILFGLVTFVTGVFYLKYLPDSQLSVPWLNEREKAIAVDRIKGNFQGIGNYLWQWYQVREAFLDPRTYIYFVFSMLENIPNGGIGVFGSIIISSFGFGSRLSLLLNMPIGVIDMGTKLLLMNLSDRYQDRTGFAMLALLGPTIGAVIMVTGDQTNKGLLLFGYSLIGAAGTGWGLTMASIGANTVGYTKKATANSVQIFAYAVGNWIGPQAFQAATAPTYITGKIVVATLFGLSIGSLMVLRLVNQLENRRRDKLEAAGLAPVQPEDASARDLTDREQPAFRYML